MKRFLSVLLVICLLAGFAMPAMAAEETTDNTCGEYLTWAFDEVTGTLSIKGSGAMKEYGSSSKFPWNDLRDEIKVVLTGDDVTTISSYAFSNCKNLEHVVISNGVKTIGKRAFYDCTSLYTVSIGDSLKELANQAFEGCYELYGLSLGSGLQKITSDALLETDPEVIVYDGTEEDWDEVTDRADLSKVIMQQDRDTELEGQSGSAWWEYDPHTFTVTISGGGKTKNYEGNSRDPLPWKDFVKVVRNVVLEDGVIGLGEKTFRDHKYLRNVTIPETVTTIDADAFDLSSGIEHVYYAGNQGDWSKVVVGENNKYLTGALFHWGKECPHTESVETYVCNEDGTHDMIMKCKLCEFPTAEAVKSDCVDGEDEDKTCDKCKGEIPEKEPEGGEQPDQPGEGTEPEVPACEHTEKDTAYAPKEAGKTHTVTVTCKAEGCGEQLETKEEACADADNDKKCDKCKANMPEEVPVCQHTEKTTTYTVREAGKTHNVTVTCNACGETVSETIAACSDKVVDYKCDGCGAEMLYWNYSFSPVDGVLTITGKGAMDNYTKGSSVPWYGIRTSVKKVVIENGITHIGAYSFYYCTNLTEAVIPSSVTSIGEYAFCACRSLAKVTYNGSVTKWAQVAIGDMNTELTELENIVCSCNHNGAVNVVATPATATTHTETSYCADCGEELGKTTANCSASDKVSYVAGNGTHKVQTKCAACAQVLKEETAICANTVQAVKSNSDRTHTVTVTCSDCKGTVSKETVKCVDGVDEDELCDTCKFDLHCDCKNYVIGYNSNGDHLTHDEALNCSNCGEEYRVLTPNILCYDGEDNNDQICDACGQDFSCQHVEADLYTKTEYHATAETNVLRHEKRTVVYCKNAKCDLVNKIYSSTVVETLNCEDKLGKIVDGKEVGDDICDICHRNMACAHTNTTETTIRGKDAHNTHVLKVVCNICGDVLRNTDEPCVFGVPNSACAMCGEVCSHEYNYKRTPTTNTKEEHIEEAICVYCGYVPAPVAEKCVDVDVHDGKCDDICGNDVKCTHKGTVAYEHVAETETHKVISTCVTCGEASECEACRTFIGETVKPCEDNNHDMECDLCFEAVTCKHDGDKNVLVANDNNTHKELCQYCEEVLEGKDAVACTKGENEYCACGNDLATVRIVGKGAYETLTAALADAVDGDEIIVRAKTTVEGTQVWDKDVTVTTAAVENNYSIVVKGDLTISKGTYNIGGMYGIGVTGKMTVTGGEFNADETSDYLIGNWGTLTVSGGQFNGVYCAVNNFAGTTAISGGTFSTEEKDYTGEYDSSDLFAEDGGMTVTGGIYSKTVADALIAEGYECVAKEDDTYEVAKKPEIQKFDILGVNMTLGNELKINFLIKKSDMKDGYVAKVTQTGREPVELTLWSYNDNYYAASYSVAAKEMTDVLSCEIYDAEGNLVTNPFTRTVAQYALTLLNNASQKESLKSVIVDMLNYGTEAQKYFDYNEDAYANAEVTAEQQTEFATGDVECANNQQSITNFVGANLSLEDSILLNVFFRVAYEEGLTAEISFVDYKGNEVTAEGTVSKYNASMTKVVVNQVVLADAKRPVTVTLYDGETVVGQCVESVESYIARNLNDEATGAINMAIMKFATSAYNYLGGTN